MGPQEEDGVTEAEGLLDGQCTPGLQLVDALGDRVAEGQLTPLPGLQLALLERLSGGVRVAVGVVEMVRLRDAFTTLDGRGTTVNTRRGDGDAGTTDGSGTMVTAMLVKGTAMAARGAVAAASRGAEGVGRLCSLATLTWAKAKTGGWKSCDWS